MTTRPDELRDARPADIEQLLVLWTSLFDDEPSSPGEWVGKARTWFAAVVGDRATAYVPVIEIDGAVVACAIGTLERGVPNPYSPNGRGVRLANVVTRPDHRCRGWGTALVEAVVQWAREVQADRVDLSATVEGRRIYERAGFVLTRAPRMKLTL